MLTDAGPVRSRLSVLLKDPSTLAAAQARIAALAQGHAVRPWTELATFYAQVKLLYMAIFGFMGLVLFLVTLTLNVIALHIVRKYREQYE